MAMSHRASSSSREKGRSGTGEKAASSPLPESAYADERSVRGIETAAGTSLERGLKARHITMIAIGGAIGTGLIIGTGKALASAGPGSIFISYTFIGFIVFLVMAALGEMAAWLPMSSGFTGYASRFCDPSLGFALGWTYWFKYIIVTPNQLTAAALVIQYWLKADRVNPGVWITIFLVTILTINYFGIRFFGEFEFWLSSFKVITIIGIILLSLILVCGGGPNHDATGFRYWHDPGAFKALDKTSNDAWGRFLGFWSSMVTAIFAYLGTELVGVTVGEAQNPRRTIPRAIKLTFFRILVFYCLSVLLIGMLVPYNHQDLAFAAKNSSAGNASVSPFVVAIKIAGISGLDHVINGAILIFVFSASNSDLYIASRTLYGLASDGSAPAMFKRTDKKGLPYLALGASALFCLLAYMNVSSDSKDVFGYFVNLTTMFGLLAWISILVTHIFFVRARRAQGLEDRELPYVAPLGIWGSYFALGVCVVVAVTKNFTVFLGGTFDHASFITGYLGIPLYLALFAGHKLYTGSRRVRADECDFFSGKDVIDRQEEAFLAHQAECNARAPAGPAEAFYRRYVSWLF